MINQLNGPGSQPEGARDYRSAGVIKVNDNVGYKQLTIVRSRRKIHKCPRKGKNCSGSVGLAWDHVQMWVGGRWLVVGVLRGIDRVRLV